MFEFHFQPHKVFEKFKWEFALLAAAGLIFILTFVIYYSNSTQTTAKEDIEFKPATETVAKATTKTIFIDISGAVKNPGVYELNLGARLNEVIIKAGGLTEETDEEYFSRNFNLARILTDQDKIYIPSIDEISLGVFNETSKNVSFLDPVSQTEESSEFKISVNTATQEDLKSLPGIGPATAGKIINNRPYSTIDELLTKKAITSSVFNKIREYIDL